jgi:hypothetical protein
MGGKKARLVGKARLVTCSSALLPSPSRPAPSRVRPSALGGSRRAAGHTDRAPAHLHATDRRQHHDGRARSLASERKPRGHGDISVPEPVALVCLARCGRPPSAAQRAGLTADERSGRRIAFLTDTSAARQTACPIAAARPAREVDGAGRRWACCSANLRLTSSLTASLGKSSDAAESSMQRQGCCLVSGRLTALLAPPQAQ